MPDSPVLKKLVLQGPRADQAALGAIARLVQPQSTTPLHEHALRADGFDCTPALQDRVLDAAYAAGIDAAFVDAGLALADFGLVAMDMDSTLITIECIDEIADMQGLKPQVSAITEAAMRGELDFAESLARRVALLEGLPVEALGRVYDERLRISPGGEAMLAGVRAAGLQTLLVSGGFTFFTERLQPRLQLDHTHANVLEAAHGKLTGRVLGGIVDAEEKRRTVERTCAAIGIAPRRAIVMGDGANDLQMMGIAGLSVAFRAKPVVRAQADVALNFCGLDALLTILA
ncbi:phosphoserine phosphatase SerB [Massilia forsythiae]|uniref:Phosphoserine phosphatase n=1 Tax=Massilia forsythiae TaxID=2728020 RepID=A0A7Z2W0P1_9BURK|nr:phosphoserine phosphatase SerB [Massilia forsythiae]QJE02613.1 phosphoserine phosphatase SerB [Massilia forsythiae]